MLLLLWPLAVRKKKPLQPLHPLLWLHPHQLQHLPLLKLLLLPPKPLLPLPLKPLLLLTLPRLLLTLLPLLLPALLRKPSNSWKVRSLPQGVA